MHLVCDYTKEEMLTIIAEHASKSLPKKDGILRARLKEDGSVEVHFIETEEDKDTSSMN